MVRSAAKADLNPMEWLREEIEASMAAWKQVNKGIDYWERPLVAVASADDPLFGKLREVVDPEHLLPRDLLAEGRSVVVYFLPFHRSLGHENAQAGELAAKTWAEAYVATNRLIGSINDHLKARLDELGHTAAVTPATHNFDEQKLVSRWSHKHIGFIAGLGTFGHHRLLITSAGCCGRLGSFVTSMPLPTTGRPGQEWCLLKAGGRCGACAARCPCGALDDARFDRHLCYAQLLRNDAHYSDLPLVDVCGKCGSDVPCSYGVPRRPKKEKGAEA